MCGIAGVISIDDSRRPMLEGMLNQLSHRGPDDRGVLLGDNFALGMTRLAVVNIGNGKQPVDNSDNNLIVVFNGEIYNYRQLIIEYKHLFDEHCDIHGISEALLITKLFEEFDISFVELLRGMFAIAIWDKTNSRLVLIRDRFGEKPLYYSVQKNMIVFASEIHAFRNTASNFSVNMTAVQDVFEYGYILNQDTIFNEILVVPPATVLEIREGELTSHIYWKHDARNKISCGVHQALEILDASISASVQLQSYSERNFGVYLSGGVDSSLIAFYLQQINSKKVDSFSIGFHEKLFDESGVANSVSLSIGTSHHTFLLSPTRENLERCLFSLDQPFADSSYFPSFFLNQFAHDNGIVVAFGGDGGDESFLGYDRYRAILIAHRFRIPLRLSRYLVKNMDFRSSRYSKFLKVKSSYSDFYELYHELVQLNNLDVFKSVFSKDISSRNRKLSRGNFLENVEDLIELDLNTYLPGDILFKTDRASMAHGVELRSPFLDHKYFELASSLPTPMRIRLSQGKFLLKKLVSKKIPEVDFYRTKMGFGIPRADWMRGPFLPILEEILLSESCKNRGWFDVKQLRHEIEMHKSGNDRDNILWPALIIESWAQRWL